MRVGDDPADPFPGGWHVPLGCGTGCQCLYGDWFCVAAPRQREADAGQVTSLLKTIPGFRESESHSALPLPGDRWEQLDLAVCRSQDAVAQGP